MENILPKLQDWAVQYGMKVVAALAILIIGWWAAKIVRGITVRIMRRGKLEDTLIFFRFEQFVAGALCPGRDVGHGARIGSQYFQHAADRDTLDLFAGLDHGHGALEPLGIQRLLWCKLAHFLSSLSICDLCLDEKLNR